MNGLTAPHVLAYVAVLLLASALSPGAGQAQIPPPGVFSAVQTDLVPDIGVALEPATMRSRVVQVDTAQLTAARLGQQALRLNLFDDAAIDVRIDRVRPTRSGYFITGSPEGFEWGEVRMVVNGPVMVGTVVTPEGKYTIRFGGAGRHVIRQVDPSAERLQNDVVEPPPPAGPPQAVVPGNPLGSVVRSATDQDVDQPTEDGSEVRILVVYTPARQAQQGGASGMQALIDLMIESANQAFEDSAINARLVLAHSALVDYVETDARTDLDRLYGPDDGYMDEVHALRNEHAADLVHLLTASMGLFSGLANTLPEENLGYEDWAAFAVTAVDSEETFTHEVGHNFGMIHDRFVDGSDSPIYPHAFGYVNSRAFEPGAGESARWRTVMAYNTQCHDAGFACSQLLRFANPDQTFRGDPLGVPADYPDTGSEGPADARLTINSTARWIGSFRSEACTQFAVSPQAPVVSVDGTEVVVRVSAGPGCLWRASSQSAFLTLQTEARRSGSGIVSINVEPNETGEERNGTVSVAGTTVEFRQLAVDAGICSRTFGVVQAIAGDVPCDEIGDEHLSEVTSLQLHEQGLTVLDAGDFEGLTNLRSLSLDDNQLTELPEDLFAGIPNLEILSLSANSLTELPAGLFAGLTKLRDLRIEVNELESLPDGVFAELPALRYLSLASNKLSGISEGAFAGLSGLRSLNLENNDLSEIPESAFAALTGLTSLALGGNAYDTLSADLFSDLENLQSLSIGGATLSALPEAILASLSNLRSFSLQRSTVSELAPGLFGGLSRLESLTLVSNELASLPETVFAGLTALEQLGLRWNELDSLPSGIFSGLVALRRLDLADNRLSGLPDGIFSGLTSLETLALDGNSADPLPFGLNLEMVGDHGFKAVAPPGAPFAIELPLTVSDSGELAGGADSITIPAGAVESEPVSVTRVVADTDITTATVDIASLPPLPASHSGYVFARDASLPVEIPLSEELGPPARVTEVEIARRGTSLRVSWTPVSGADGYKVQWKSGYDAYDEETRQAVVAGGDTLSYTIRGLTAGTEYSVRVLATRAGADDGPFSEEVSGTTRSGDPDVNGDGALDGDDAQIMWYAYRFASLVGDGETGGTEALRQRFLGGYSDLDDPSDEDLRTMVAKANAWRTQGLAEGGDINADGMIDASDARAMYYAYTYASLLGDGEDGGTARFRMQLLGPLAGTADPTDEELEAMLRRANELREAYSP